MRRHDPVKRLSRKTLRLINEDLDRIKKYKDKRGWAPLPGLFSKELARYANCLMNIKRTTDKVEDAQRAWLKKLSTKELRELASAKEAEILSDKKLPESAPKVGKSPRK